MFLRHNLLKLPLTKSRTEFLQQYLEARCFCDDKRAGSEVEVSTNVKPKSNSLVREVKSEVAQIHATYRSEVLVKLESEEGERKDVSLAEGEGDTALSEKYIVKFESRLDHFRKSGYIFDPVEISAPDEPSISPFVDKAIDVMKLELGDRRPSMVIPRMDDLDGGTQANKIPANYGKKGFFACRGLL